MRAITIVSQGSPVTPNVRVRDDFESPVAGTNEVIVRTEASAFNHLDLWVGRGLPGIDIQYPAIGGSDGCGIVESVGEGVAASWIGTRVLLNAAVPKVTPLEPNTIPTPCDITMIGEHVHGCHAEKFRAPVANLLPVGSADPVKAAAFGLAFLTAWRMMVTQSQLREGQLVLITGIGGGVALAALSIARHFGCTTMVTSRHASKLARAAELGANHGVLDTGADFSKEVRKLTGRRGVDLAVDSVGKSAHLSCIKALARGGTYATCGATTGGDAVTDLTRIFWNQLRIVGSTMGDMREFREVFSLYAAGKLTPVVDQVFPAADAVDAYRKLEAGEQFGKIVLDWS